jgi:dTDP-4-amino-4,6-dideoxygalactose transaminase
MTVFAGASVAPASDVSPETLAHKEAERWPFYDVDEIQAVVDLLRSGQVNQWTSDKVFEFERACAQRLGGGRGIAVANGSVALELALRAFGIGPGDEVIVTPRTFVASASCVRLVGATPIFADVDPDSGNITAETVRPALSPRTRAIIPVHLAGWPIDMAPLMALASEAGIRVIEDCAQAHGAHVNGQPVGSFGHAAAFSFCQDKIISTAGEGGYASFRDQSDWEWAWSFKDHGKNLAKVKTPATRPGFRWLHDNVGTNWRLTAPQAALGIVQLGKLDEWRALRARNASIWAAALAGIPGLRVPLPPEGFAHAFYKLYVYIDGGDETAALRDEFLKRGAAAGLRIFSGSCSEVYLERAFADLPKPDLPVARRLGESSIMCEVHPTLDPDLLGRRASVLAQIAKDVLSGSSISEPVDKR